MDGRTPRHVRGGDAVFVRVVDNGMLLIADSPPKLAYDQRIYCLSSSIIHGKLSCHGAQHLHAVAQTKPVSCPYHLLIVH
jgi:hypothetical protein